MGKMQDMVKTFPYNKLSDWEYFRKARCDEKAIYWYAEDVKHKYFPLSLSIDTILFSLRG
ncbi:MAG: hypothetical protein WCD89_10025 [Anaerocolumna sp.]